TYPRYEALRRNRPTNAESAVHLILNYPDLVHDASAETRERLRNPKPTLGLSGLCVGNAADC
ncbi:hypothetical protein, partial [Paraburkholderia podalyriae]|uniref:hypothetical protein n=1 Tax=Paraburkholderia podalyriae TaxID=1938811 RepID=UPI001CA3BF26